jgi:hypothetical protein
MFLFYFIFILKRRFKKMRSFKKFQETLVQKRREARSRIVKHEDYRDFKFITAWSPDLILLENHNRFDTQYGFVFSKKNIIDFVNDYGWRRSRLHNCYDNVTIAYDQRYDLYNNLRREGDIEEGYIPQVDFVELDIWNSKEGWLF